MDADHELRQALYGECEGDHHGRARQLEERQAVENDGDGEGRVAQGPVHCKGDKADQRTDDKQHGCVEDPDPAHGQDAGGLLGPHDAQLPAEETLPRQHLDGERALRGGGVEAAGKTAQDQVVRIVMGSRMIPTVTSRMALT